LSEKLCSSPLRRSRVGRHLLSRCLRAVSHVLLLKGQSKALIFDAGVNVLTGIFKNVPDDQVREQDYIVPGLQLWIDGAMTEEGVVRQVRYLLSLVAHG
jgi:hypothetical protein